MRRTPIFLAVLLPLVTSARLLAAAPILGPMTATPSIVFITQKDRHIVVRVPVTTSLSQARVRLWKTAPDDTPTKAWKRLKDAGHGGDELAYDGVFTARLALTGSRSRTIRMRACADFPRAQNAPMECSDPLTIRLTAPAVVTPPAPDEMFDLLPGLPCAINQVIVLLSPASPDSTIDELTHTLNASVVGFSPSLRSYTLKMPITASESLDAIVAQLRADPRLAVVTRLCQFSTTAFDTDLDHLRESSPGAAQAYDAIRVEDAWKAIASAAPPLSSPRVGVIDGPVDKSHPEFQGVRFGLSPTSAFIKQCTTRSDCDPNGASSCELSHCWPGSWSFQDILHEGGHGTSVAGIVGANNISTVNPINSDGFGINGILAGVPDPTTPAGSRVLYTLEVRQKGSGDLGALFDDLDSVGTRVVNMSFGVSPKSVCDRFCNADPEGLTCDNCAGMPDDEYNAQRMYLTKAIYEHPSMLFVAAAGNAHIQATLIIPGGIVLPNLVTVAAPDRIPDYYPHAGSYFSNFGAAVTLAAPGMFVYAPTWFSPPLADEDYTL